MCCVMLAGWRASVGRSVDVGRACESLAWSWCRLCARNDTIIPCSVRRRLLNVIMRKNARAAVRFCSTAARSKAGAELHLHLYAEMARIRAFERRVVDLFSRKMVKGTAHSCEGQEATAVGVGNILSDDDYILSHHRGHGHVLDFTADHC